MRKYQVTQKTKEQFLPSFVGGGGRCAVLSALIVGGISAWLLVPFAYEQRGYSAIGGEWMFTLVVSFAEFQISNWFLEKIEIK